MVRLHIIIYDVYDPCMYLCLIQLIVKWYLAITRVYVRYLQNVQIKFHYKLDWVWL